MLVSTNNVEFLEGHLEDGSWRPKAAVHCNIPCALETKVSFTDLCSHQIKNINFTVKIIARHFSNRFHCDYV